MVPPAAQTHQLIQIVQATCAPAAKVEPLLSGSAGVTALALVVALAVYLRNVSSNTQDNIEDILSDSSKVWHKGENHTHRRLALLSNTRQNIEDLTPVMFALAVAFGLRVLAGAFPLHWWQQYIVPTFPWIDFSLLAFFIMTFAGMWRAHHKIKAKEIPIRHEMYRNIGQSALIRKSWWERFFPGILSLFQRIRGGQTSQE